MKQVDHGQKDQNVRLDQLLSHLGYGSRREVKAMVKGKRVTVNGEIVRDSGMKIAAADVRMDGEELEEAGLLYILLNKPTGHVCSHDEREGIRVYDLLPAQWMRRKPQLTSVGRLDKDTTGTLLITNDKELVHRLTSPRHHVNKIYRAELDGEADPAWVAEFAAGTLVLDGEDRACAPATLNLTTDPSIVEITLTEGRYHQVKRMFAALGATVVKLHRFEFAGISADHLPIGQWEKLSADFIERRAAKSHH